MAGQVELGFGLRREPTAAHSPSQNAGIPGRVCRQAPLWSDASLVFFASLLTGVLNLLFQLVTVRYLSAADFGLFNSLLVLTMNVTVVSGPLQTVTATYIAGYRALGQWWLIREFLWKFAVRVMLFAGAVLAVCMLGEPVILAMVHLEPGGDSRFVVLLVAVGIAVGAAVPFLIGALQGLQKFRSLSAASLINGLIRVAAGMLFLRVGLRVAGALGAMIAAGVTALFYCFFPLWRYVRRPTEMVDASPGIAMGAVYRFMAPTLVGLQSFLLLTSMDMLFVRHYFSAETAGNYAVAQMVGKLIFFLPGALATVVLPKLVDRHTRGIDTRALLGKTLLAVGGICGLAALVTLLVPVTIIRVFAGRQVPEAIPLLLPFVVAMTFFALNQIFLVYYLAKATLRKLLPFVIAMLIQAVFFLCWHSSLLQIVYTMVVVSAGLFFYSIGDVYGNTRTAA